MRCEDYIRTQKVTGGSFSGGDLEKRSDELRLTHGITSRSGMAYSHLSQ
jgi:hypothetical protein